MASAHAAGPPSKILVIDDDVKLCRLIRDYLEPMGYQVSSAHNGPLASKSPKPPDIPFGQRTHFPEKNRLAIRNLMLPRRPVILIAASLGCAIAAASQTTI